MYNSDFCFTHNPATKKEKRKAAIKGGKANKKVYGNLEEVKIESQKDVVALIAKTINEVRKGLVEVRIANCTFYGCGHLIKALEIADLEERVAEIEKVISEQNMKNR
jgi:hypothetical protein